MARRFAAAPREAARRLLSVGHTSGADALLGMRLAWAALARRLPQGALAR